ncbi:nucleotide exchange factor GrpE [Arthrobacter zhaoxinii]|uniref:nucleotide exchange factor GrpE n=1 Tax=Arthrobacter zhaoxinii TaxID=2964616 RepID=UPI002105DCD9|nr:nucleotide exchange factor GrpE [Arthrobacter zhaoxinii]MCQ2001128.1 nucleotide exchange factor GrpE [Arthrobacter zhaoxinii]
MTNDLSPGRETGSSVDADDAADTGTVQDLDAVAGSAEDSAAEPPEEIQADAPETLETAGGTLEAAGGTPIPDDSTALLGRINAALESFHSRAEHYEETNRLLHTRIESLQSDQVRVLLKPVFERLATMQAQAVDAAADARGRDSSSAGDFEFFAISIDELLALYDVEPVGAAPGITFDSKLHHGARIVPTADLELDGRIQRVQRQGYRYAGADRVMLPARVSVYRYTAPAPETALDSDRSTS